MEYLIFGQAGWLANKIKNYLDGAEISDADCLDLPAIRRELDEKKPKVVINAAGITGRPNIDWCENHKTETIAGNVTLPLNILQACSERNIYWVHFGSGCIYQGNGPDGKGFSAQGGPSSGWKEDDEARPPSFYSWTKYWTDSILRHFPVLILRLRLPIDVEPNFRNYIDKVSKYPNVIDTENSVTIIPDFLLALKTLVDKRRVGIYHVTNPGTIRPSEIVEIYKRIVKPDHEFKVIPAEELYKQGLAKAIRSNCILNTDKLQAEGVVLKPIQERIIEVMEEYKKRLG
ncbi:MAG: sugar nucleotide-binding protein [Candidatus Portnoybacteria bacterium]|nr:sugar nucleotide-binding protein [Candidatus Portnoybacteria bacterium]